MALEEIYAKVGKKKDVFLSALSIMLKGTPFKRQKESYWMETKMKTVKKFLYGKF